MVVTWWLHGWLHAVSSARPRLCSGPESTLEEGTGKVQGRYREGTGKVQGRYLHQALLRAGVHAGVEATCGYRCGYRCGLQMWSQMWLQMPRWAGVQAGVEESRLPSVSHSVPWMACAPSRDSPKCRWSHHKKVVTS